MTVVILGGGIGGLSTAYYLLKSSTHKVVLIEATNRLGGWIRSERQPSGLVLEQGPRTLRPVGEAGLNTLNLIDELNQCDKVKPILSSHPAAKNRFVYTLGKLHALPTSISSIFQVQPPFTKPLVNILWHDWNATAKYVEDDSIYNFVERRFGSEIAEYAVSPLICGICGGDSKKISVNFLLSDMFEKEQKYGSVTKAYLRPWVWKRKQSDNFFKKLKEMLQKQNINKLASRAQKENWSSYTMEGGLEILPRTLKSKVEEAGGTIMTDSKVVKVDLHKKFVTVDKDDISFDFLVSAIPAFSFGSLIYKDNYMLAKELLNIPYTTIITVNLVYEKRLLDVDGFGFLVPPAENLPLLGVIFDHCYAPHKDWTILTVMMGGHAFDTFFRYNCTEEYIIDTALQNLLILLNIKEKPNLCKVSVLDNCIPQHVIGHKKRITWIKNHIELEKLPLFLVGNAYQGTGINDVILSARQTVHNIVNFGKSDEEQYPTPMYTVEYV